MIDATSAATTIRPEEAAHFAALAKDWWDPAGSSAMLHRLNPVRLDYLRAAIDTHWDIAPDDLRPLAGRRALDVGCGAGLLCEPLARLGARVTGIDAAAANIEAALLHAAGSGLEIDYRFGELGSFGLAPFDLVTCFEVLEHVADKPAFVAELARHLAPGGLMVLSTPNRTSSSRLWLVGVAEAIGRVPRGTHRWEDFATPDELRTLLVQAGLAMSPARGIAWSPLRGLHLSGDLSLDYLVTATRA